MSFQRPGGELTFWSVIWIIAALGQVYLGFATDQSYYFWMAVAIGIPSIGMWFDLRPAGYLFAGLLVLSVILGVLLLTLKDTTFTERAIRVGKIIAGIYFMRLSYSWARGDF